MDQVLQRYTSRSSPVLFIHTHNPSTRYGIIEDRHPHIP